MPARSDKKSKRRRQKQRRLARVLRRSWRGARLWGRRLWRRCPALFWALALEALKSVVQAVIGHALGGGDSSSCRG